jgi:hypothetical protein
VTVSPGEGFAGERVTPETAVTLALSFEVNENRINNVNVKTK